MLTRPTRERSREASRRRARTGSAIVASLVGGIALSFACSSSSTPNPPSYAGCVEMHGVPCTGASVGGGSSSAGDGSTSEEGSAGGFGDATSCPGASSIFGTSNAACIACAAANCCLNPTSCPNQSACAAIASCAIMCLPNDPTCLSTCEGASSMATIVEYTDLVACTSANCSTCPTLLTSNTDI